VNISAKTANVRVGHVHAVVVPLAAWLLCITPEDDKMSAPHPDSARIPYATSILIPSVPA
jgi:hypothetical protein